MHPAKYVVTTPWIRVRIIVVRKRVAVPPNILSFRAMVRPIALAAFAVARMMGRFRITWTCRASPLAGDQANISFAMAIRACARRVTTARQARLSTATAFASSLLESSHAGTLAAAAFPAGETRGQETKGDGLPGNRGLGLARMFSSRPGELAFSIASSLNDQRAVITRFHSLAFARLVARLASRTGAAVPQGTSRVPSPTAAFDPAANPVMRLAA